MNRFLFLAAGMIVLCGCQSPKHSRLAPLKEIDGHLLGTNQAGAFSLPPNVTLDNGIREEDAISIALWNNAAFLEALADIGISRADAVQAGMFPNPTLSMLVPWGAKGLELTARYPMEALWLRPQRVATATANYDQT